MTYGIYKNGSLISVATDAVWVKKQENGSFVICERNEAEGFVFNGVAQLFTGDLIISEITEQVYKAFILKDVESAICEMSMNTDTRMNNIEATMCQATIEQEEKANGKNLG